MKQASEYPLKRRLHTFYRLDDLTTNKSDNKLLPIKKIINVIQNTLKQIYVFKINIEIHNVSILHQSQTICLDNFRRNIDFRDDLLSTRISNS